MADEKQWQAGRERFEHDKRQQKLADRRAGLNRKTDKQIDKETRSETNRAFATAVHKANG